MADGKVVIDSEIDDNGISKGIKNIKDKLRSLDSNLIRTAALGAAIQIAPAAVPAVSALTGGILALSSAFGAAGIGVAGFGAVAVPTLSEIFEANDAILKAEEKLAKADSAKERAAAMEELKAATAGLSDAQKEALKSYQEFTSYWDEFAGRFQEPVLDLFTSSLQTLKTLLELSEPAIQGAARAFDNLMKSLNQSLETSEAQAFFDYIGREAGPTIENFGRIAGNVLLGIMNLMRAFSPLSNEMQVGLLGLSQRFAEWTASLSGSAAFQAFVDYVRANGPTLISILGNVGLIIFELVKAFAPFGSAALDAINVITSLTAQFIQANPAISAVGAAVVMLAGKLMALAPVISSVVSGVSTFIGWLASLFAQVNGTSQAFTMLRTAFTVLTGPIGIVGAAITGLIAIFVQMWRTNEEFRNKVIEIWTAIQTTISTAVSAIRAFIMQIWGQIKTFWNENQNSILAATKNVWSIIQAVINTALTAIMAIFRVVWPVLETIVKNVWNNIKGTIQGSLNVIKGLIQLFSGIFTGDFSKMWEGIKNIFSGAIQAIVNIFNLMLYGRLLSLGKALFSGLKGIVQAGWNNIKSLFQGSVSSISTLVSNGFTTIKTIINSTMNSIKSIVTGIWNGIKATTTSVMNGIKSVITGVWNAINSTISTVVNSIKSIVNVGFQTMKNVVNEVSTNIKSIITKVWNDIISFLKAIDLFSIGKNIMQGLFNGISSMAGVIVDKAKDIANSVTKTIKSALDIHSPSRVMMEIGKNIGEGLVLGMNSSISDISQASQKMADEAIPDFSRQVNISGRLIKRFRDNVIEDVDEAEDVIADIQRFIESHIKWGNITVAEEAWLWEYAARKFKEGSEERVRALEKANELQNALYQEQFAKEKAYIENRKKYQELSLTQELAIYEQYLQTYKEGSEQRIFYENEVFRVRQEINKKTDEINANYLSKVQALNQQLIDEENKLNAEYQKALDDRAKSLVSFAGLFEEVTSKELSGETLIHNLQSQVNAFEEWQKNITELASKAIDEGLLAELRAMGPKAFSEIAALNSLTEEQLQQYSDLWKEKNRLAKEQAAIELEYLNVDTQKKIEELRNTTATQLLEYQKEWQNAMIGVKGVVNTEFKEMPSIGQYAVSGLIEGMMSKRSQLVSVAQEMANAVSSTFANALDIHSPSRVMRDEIGKWIPIGLAEGISRNISAVVSATNRMAQAAIPTVPNLNGAAGGSFGATTSAATTINVPKMAGAKIENHFHFQSNAPTPSEVARKNLQVSRQLAMEWGL